MVGPPGGVQVLAKEARLRIAWQRQQEDVVGVAGGGGGGGGGGENPLARGLGGDFDAEAQVRASFHGLQTYLALPRPSNPPPPSAPRFRAGPRAASTAAAQL